MKYAWIARHKNHWPVSLACDVLSVSTSGFFESMRRQGIDQPSKPGANKRISNEALLAQDVEGTGGPRRPCRQGARAAHAARARHQSQGASESSWSPPTANTSCPLPRTCCSARSRLAPPIKCGRVTSPTSRPTRVDCTWPWLRRAPDEGVIFHSDRGPILRP